MSSDGSIPVKLGDQIPLNINETNLDSTKVIKATLFDLKDLSLLPGVFPIIVAHVANGIYFDNSFEFPDGVSQVYAEYLIFDANGTTPNTTGAQNAHDIFALDDLGGAVDAILAASISSDIIVDVGVVSSEEVGVIVQLGNDPINVEIEQPNLIDVKVLQDGIVGIEIKQDELINIIVECS